MVVVVVVVVIVVVVVVVVVFVICWRLGCESSQELPQSGHALQEVCVCVSASECVGTAFFPKWGNCEATTFFFLFWGGSSCA